MSGGVDMGMPELYTATCWSTTSTNSTTNLEKQNFRILLFGEELDLDNGVKQMERDGWELIGVQQTNTKQHSPPGATPERIYLFRKAVSTSNRKLDWL
jgi:hypothetical protein